MIRSALLFSLLPLGVSCKKEAPVDATNSDISAAVLGSIDPAVDPCTDFYQYACGTWLAKTEFPADRVFWGRTWSTISDRNEALQRQVLEDAAKDAGGDPVRAQLGAFYGACMDTDGRDARGVTPLQPQLDAIAAAKTPAELARVMGQLQASGVNVLFEMYVDADYKDPSLNIAQFYQGGLGLPDREYYLSDEEPYKSTRGEYTAHITRMLGLLGTSAEDAAKQADAILAFETTLANASLPNDQLTDPETTYHRVERTGLESMAQGFDWTSFMAGLGYPDMQQINVATPDFFKAMPGLVSGASADTLAAYLRYHLLTEFAGALNSEVSTANFEFYGKKLYGAPAQKPQWRRCLDATNDAMGEALGQAYVEQAFSADSKTAAVEMITGIENAFEAGLPQAAWMDDATRSRAADKVHAVTNKVGYPDKWRDWSGLHLPTGDYFAGVLSANRFNTKFYADKIGKPVDRTDWWMTPQMVNAYYNPLNNEMVFPAGILQPPFFAADYPRAMNYGGMGMIMGHELTHGFDDGGRKFAPDGRMMEWWDPAAAERFEAAAQCIVDQYGAYEPQPGLKLNGSLTEGENIADNGGIKAAYRAYNAWVAKTGGEPAEVTGLTNNQLFFVAFAQGWCSMVRPEAERVMTLTDTHSPPKFRVNGPLSNLPEFATAFECKAGAPMAPEKGCSVW